jgi:hypothetical protein
MTAAQVQECTVQQQLLLLPGNFHQFKDSDVSDNSLLPRNVKDTRLSDVLWKQRMCMPPYDPKK